MIWRKPRWIYGQKCYTIEAGPGRATLEVGRLKKFTRLQRILASYVVLFFIPVLVIGVLFSLFFIQRYKAEQLDSCTKSVQTVMNMTQEKLSSLRDLAAQLQYDETVLAAKNEIYPIRMLEAQVRLQAYQLVNGQLDELTFLYRGSDNIVSSKTTYSPATFPQLMPQCRSISQQQLYEQCRTAQEVSWHSAVTAGGRNVALGIYPVPAAPGGKYGTMVLSMDVEKFSQGLFSSFPYEGAAFQIRATDGETVLASPQCSFSAAVQGRDGLFTATDANHRRFVVFTREMPLNGLSVSVYVPRDRIFYFYERFFGILFATICVLLAVGAVTIWQIAKGYSSTARSLRQAMQGVQGSAGQAGQGDELAAAVDSIEYLKGIAGSLKENLNNSQQIIDELEKYRIVMREKLAAQATPEKTAVERAVRCAQEHFTEEDLSVNQLARAACMSASALAQQFKREMGVSPSQYIVDLRINKAKELLVSTRQPVSAIAQQIGYADTSAFIRKFRQQTGVTPGKFREWYWEQSPDGDAGAHGDGTV